MCVCVKWKPRLLGWCTNVAIWGRAPRRRNGINEPYSSVIRFLLYGMLNVKQPKIAITSEQSGVA